MPGASDPNKVINANENLRASWLQHGYAEYAEYAPHIPVANWLIKKYCTQWWKNHPELWDYQIEQFSICMELNGSRGSREYTLDAIATYLKCNPLLLMNDRSPELDGVK